MDLHRWKLLPLTTFGVQPIIPNFTQVHQAVPDLTNGDG
jgi:hypothetical protein